MADCQHVWIYDHKDWEHMYQRCKRCGRMKVTDVLTKMIHPYQTSSGLRPPSPVGKAMQVARELNIRHDNADGDV